MSLGRELCLAIINRFDEGTEWATELENGFDWWPGERRISLRFYNPPNPEDAEKICWLYFFTDVIENASPLVQTLFNLDARNCAMSAHINLESENRLVLGNGAVVFSDEWNDIVGRLFTLAVMQYAEASFCAKEISNRMQMQAPFETSAHPTKGPRQEPSSFISMFDSVILRTGEPSDDDNGAFIDHLSGMSTRIKEDGWSLFSGFVNSGLTIELPFGDEMTSKIVCEIENHPRMGKGIRITQRFPVYLDTSENDLMPSRMSAGEVFLYKDPTFPEFVVGSFFWPRKAFGKPFLHWSCFVPEFMIRTEINPQLKLYLDTKLEDALVCRTRYISKAFSGIDLTKEDVKSKRDNMKFMLDVLDDDNNQEMADYMRDAIGRDGT